MTGTSKKASAAAGDAVTRRNPENNADRNPQGRNREPCLGNCVQMLHHARRQKKYLQRKLLKQKKDLAYLLKQASVDKEGNQSGSSDAVVPDPPGQADLTQREAMAGGKERELESTDRTEAGRGMYVNEDELEESQEEEEGEEDEESEMEEVDEEEDQDESEDEDISDDSDELSEDIEDVAVPSADDEDDDDTYDEEDSDDDSDDKNCESSSEDEDYESSSEDEDYELSSEDEDYELSSEDDSVPYCGMLFGQMVPRRHFKRYERWIYPRSAYYRSPKDEWTDEDTDSADSE